MESNFVEIDTVRKTFDLGKAGGQLKEETRFIGGEGMLIREDGGESTSLSVGIAGKLFGFSLSVGTATAGVVGKGTKVPADGHYYKLGVMRTVDVTGYKMYER